MPIPAEVLEVIRLANIQDVEEKKLQSLRDEKETLQADIDLVIHRISIQVPVVQAARAALKAAAQAM